MAHKDAPCTADCEKYDEKAADEIIELVKASVQSESRAEKPQAVEIGFDGRAYVIGIPATATDDNDADAHNCDTMRCPTTGAHTLYVLPLDADHRPMNAAGERINIKPTSQAYRLSADQFETIVEEYTEARSCAGPADHRGAMKYALKCAGIEVSDGQ